MNLQPTENGLKIIKSEKNWFNENYINFKYRLKNRKFLISWIYSIARSVALIDGIRKHDWLRKRAGILESVTAEYYLPIVKNFIKIITSNKKFFQIESTDFTTNSRLLLKDLVATSINNGLEIITDNELREISSDSKGVTANCEKGIIKGKKMAICTGGGLEKFTNIKIKKSYAPIAIVKNVSPTTKSFVELDYFKNKCINIITKGSSFAMIGGISLSEKKDVEDYFNYMIEEHKKKIQILKFWKNI